MKKKKKKKSKYLFLYWMAGSILVCGLLGYLLDSMAIGIVIGIAVGGFTGVLSRLGG